MKILKLWIVSIDQIRFNKKLSFLVIVLIGMSITSMGLVSFYSKLYDYSELSCKQALASDIDKVGLISTQDDSYYSEEALSFLREAKSSDKINSIGSVQTLRVDDRLSELAAIQNRNSPEPMDGSLEWIHMDKTVLDLCSLSCSSKIDVDLTKERKNVFYLFLGSNFKEIKAGTEYYYQIDDTTKWTYIVAGILYKGETLITDNIAEGGGAGTSVSTRQLDNAVICTGDAYPSSGRWIYCSSDTTDLEEAEAYLSKLASAHNLNMSFASLSADFKYSKIKAKQIQDIFGELFGLTTIGTVIINLCLFSVLFFSRMKDYGILYANGFSSGELRAVFVIENFLKCSIGCLAAAAVIYNMMHQYFVYDADTLRMINYIFFRQIAWELIIMDLLFTAVFSIAPCVLLRKYSPNMLMKGTI